MVDIEHISRIIMVTHFAPVTQLASTKLVDKDRALMAGIIIDIYVLCVV